MRRKLLWMFAIGGMAIVTMAAMQQSAPLQNAVEVRLGEKGAKGDTLGEPDHNITLEALRYGTTEFLVKGADGAVFIVDLNLPSSEILSFAGGTALIVAATPATEANDNDEGAVEGFVPAPGARSSLVVTLQLVAAPADTGW